MIFKTLTGQEYKDFALKHPYISVYQFPEWGELKKPNGWKSHLVGLLDNNKIIAASLLLEKPTIIKKSIFYAPRGLLMDYNDEKIVNKFVDEIKKYVKNNKGFMLKIDPNVIYQFRDSNGNPIEEKNEKAFKNLINCGFKHMGFNLNFETMQPRFLCRFKIVNNYEDTKATFSKSTRKNIDNSQLKGIEVRKGTIDDVEEFVNMMNETASRKKFALRPVSYYEHMYKLFKNYSEIYIASINTKKYLCNIEEELKNENENNKNILEKMKNEKVGKNLIHQLELSDNKIKKLSDEVLYAKTLCQKEDNINIGSLYSLYMNDEGITFMSGINADYKKFNPKYAMYDEHIKETIKRKLNYVNFYGISGDFNPKNKNYNIYELKKGYNPIVIELLGEFDMVINKLDYIAYNSAFNIYTKIKRIRSKK